MHSLNLNHVLTFLAVAEAGGFRAAAEQLHVTQSAISIRVRQLENQIGIPLFHRTTRTVELTTAGLRLLTAARRIKAEAESIAAELSEEAKLRTGKIEVASVASAAASLLPTLISRFGERYPGIIFKLFDVESSRALAMIRNGEVDIGILPSTDQVMRFEVDLLFRDEYVAVVPATGHALSDRETVSLAEVARYPLLLNPRGVVLRDAIDRSFRELGIEPEPFHETYNALTLIALTRTNLGITILSRMSLHGVELSGCRVVSLSEPLAREIVMVRPKGKADTPAAAAFRAFVKATSLAERGRTDLLPSNI